MSKGKYYSLEEARQANDLEGFAKEHPSVGNQKRFDDCLNRMALNKPIKKPAKDDQTSKKG